ncbi:FAD synthase, partial [Candidatus Falkowbacteria bacterium]|nr:FAD synthase [Candidatus Falkowbacteria bacterium]
MTKVMVFGTFDIFHPGHVNFLRQARKYGDYLIVIIARDKTVLNIKKSLPRYQEKKRLAEIIKSNLTDKAVLGSLRDKYQVVKKYQPAVICLGYDQKNFINQLAEKLKQFKLKTKIVRLKPYRPK